MSFDVFFQRFTDGEADPGGGVLMRQVLGPFIVSEEPDAHFARVEYGDGGADVHLDGDNLMANHVTGEGTWDLLVESARTAGCVILPVGCPTCITDEAQRRHLPEGLGEEIEVVLSGARLREVIQSDCVHVSVRQGPGRSGT